MTAPDRPTREQVDADLEWADDGADTADHDRVRRLAAEVRALRAEANCGEGHDPTRICCAHAKGVRALSAELAEIRQAADEHPDVPHGDLLGELRRLVENDGHCTETHGTDRAALVARTPQSAEARPLLPIERDGAIEAAAQALSDGHVGELDEDLAARAVDAAILCLSSQPYPVVLGPLPAVSVTTDVVARTPQPAERDLLRVIEWGLFGTTDGDLLADDEQVPVGELRRLLRDEVMVTLAAPLAAVPDSPFRCGGWIRLPDNLGGAPCACGDPEAHRPASAPSVPDGEDAARLRQDCASPDHEWVRCQKCPTAGPCACAGGPCCQRERAELDAEDRPDDPLEPDVADMADVRQALRAALRGRDKHADEVAQLRDQLARALNEEDVPARLDVAAETLASVRPVLAAALAYADSTNEPTDTPHEDALLDAVIDCRPAVAAALARPTERES